MPRTARNGERQQSAVTIAKNDSRFRKIAIVVCRGEASTYRDIAARTKLSESVVRRCVEDHRDEFMAVWREVSQAMLGSVSEIARNELEEQLLRDWALSVKHRTIAAKLCDQVDAWLERSAGSLTAGEVKAATGLYTAISDRVGDRGGARPGAPGSTTVNIFAPTVQQAGVIRAAYRESGVSLSDVIDCWDEETEPSDAETVADETPDAPTPV